MSSFTKIAATPIGEVDAGPPVSVPPETPLRRVVEEMHRHHSGAALVVGDTGILGILTESDVMRRIDHRDQAWHATPVRSVMTPSPTTIRTTQTIEDAINLMTVGSFRRLPVLDPEGRPVAVVSIRDVLACMVEFYPQDFVNLPPDPDREATGRWGG
jgi:CBS domain-containing protein